MLNWQLSQLSALDPLAVLDLFKLRQDVFILEQSCLYQDIDSMDRQAWHLLGREEEGYLAAYLRIIPPDGKHSEPALGRVVTSTTRRRHGYGQTLLREGIKHTQTLFPALGIRLSAQTYLLNFYQSFGFQTTGKPYVEDGIEHIDMLRLPAPKPMVTPPTKSAERVN